jgi:hypothetical protein
MNDITAGLAKILDPVAQLLGVSALHGLYYNRPVNASHVAAMPSTLSLLSDMGGQQRAVGRHVFPEGLTTCGVTDLVGLTVQAGTGDLQHLHGACIASRGQDLVAAQKELR